MRVYYVLPYLLCAIVSSNGYVSWSPLFSISSHLQMIADTSIETALLMIESKIKAIENVLHYRVLVNKQNLSSTTIRPLH